MDPERPAMWQTPASDLTLTRRDRVVPDPRPLVMEKAAATSLTPAESLTERPEIVNADYCTLATTLTSSQYVTAVAWVAEAQALAKAAGIQKTYTLRYQHRTTNSRAMAPIDDIGGIVAMASTAEYETILEAGENVRNEGGEVRQDPEWDTLTAGIENPNAWCNGTPGWTTFDEVVLLPDPSLIRRAAWHCVELAQGMNVSTILFSTKREHLSVWNGAIYQALGSERSGAGGPFGDSPFVLPTFSGAQFDAGLDLFARTVWQEGGIHVLVDEKDRTAGPAWFDPVVHSYRIGEWVDIPAP